MKSSYDHKKIEGKWQKYWEKKKLYNAKDPKKGKNQKKFFPLIEFPYPSGQGLHVGHIRSNTAMDIIARKRRMEGYNVLYPIGWDAFGLPTENFAIKNKLDPAIVTKRNTDTFRRQLKSLGFSFDWSREINTTDPKYYKWTQWIFLQFLKNGLAYKKKLSINWCPKDLIGLANEEVINGCCERCGTPVEKRDKEQWMLAITKYADRLDSDLDELDFLPRIKTQQRNWIGKSEGAEINFHIKGTDKSIKVYTTRPDTIFGVSYIVIAPEHSILIDIMSKVENVEDIKTYISQAKAKDEIERTNADKEKTGVCVKGISAINPANGETIPIWISDYVLGDYGTGAVMAVPAHDDRDYIFANKYNLPIKTVIQAEQEISGKAYTGNGILINSKDFNGKKSEDVKKEITNYVKGIWVNKFKLRDWVFSRQRYWGEPIPVIHCDKCGIVPVPEKELPIKLPKVKNYLPTETGESPLSAITKWVNVKCPKCKSKAKRETDTMPNWAGSSWYYLRYTDPKNKKVISDKEKLKYWTPVDWYNGGMEHTTLHLLYSRFWHKFLFDIGVVPTKEPYQKRTSHGLILAGGGEKMSKSKGNVVNPDDIVNNVGADTLRLYEMFMGPFDQAISWETDNIAGPRRFIERVWKLQDKINYTKTYKDSESTEIIINKVIKKVSDDIENMSFNTAVSSLMIAVNDLEKEKAISKKTFENLILILSPFIPHVTEELWSIIGNKASIHTQNWPNADISKTSSNKITIVVQVNGKIKASFETSKGMDDSYIENTALNMPEIKKIIEQNKVKKVIVVKDRLINIVV